MQFLGFVARPSVITLKCFNAIWLLLGNFRVLRSFVILNFAIAINEIGYVHPNLYLTLTAYLFKLMGWIIYVGNE